MTRYIQPLRKAWKYLAHQYKDDKKGFFPIKEADIQCFLYHALISIGGIRPENIHAEFKYKTKGVNRRADIKLGKYREGSGAYRLCI